MSQTSSTSSATTTASSSPCGCGCHGHALPSEGCCKLTCFERPQYFCGQLLSDADLTLEETYFREKNKLYHRTLDGFGVVCGLRMYCDGHCKGQITIGDGYAIDCCGNDLVVCEPRSFDVIGELRKKKWLIEMPRELYPERERRTASEGHSGHKNQATLEYQYAQKRNHEGEYPPDHEHDCITKQCFYIGMCYAEEAVDFVTPYSTDCTPAPTPCQPTRVREGVRFEIYDKRPVRPNPLDDIGKRIECCFRMFREGQFSRGLQDLAPRILNVLCDQKNTNPDNPDTNAQPQREKDAYKADSLFAELRAQFLHELRTCPDQYNCDLEQQVYRLRPPCRDDEDTGPSPLEAFTKLIELIHKYVFSCVLAQFAFECPEPPDPCCVLIGSVEVENGRLTHVINYPRWYLWCFANFFEVLTYQLANDAACGKENTGQTALYQQENPKASKDGCCPGFEVDVCEFLQLFHADNRALEKAARTSVDAIQAMYSSLAEGFNFMQPHGVAPGALRDLPVATAQHLSETFGFKLEPLTGPQAGQRDVFSALADNTIHFGSEALVYKSAQDKVAEVNRMMGAPAYAVGPHTYQDVSVLTEKFKHLEEYLPTLKETPPKPSDAEVHPPEERLQRLEDYVRNLEESLLKGTGDAAQALEERIKHLEEELRIRIKQMEENLGTLEKSLAGRIQQLWNSFFKKR
jgi:hypothetical protein